MTDRRSDNLDFDLHFYEAKAEAIVALVQFARRSHPAISQWVQQPRQDAIPPATRVTLRFRDRASLEVFVQDESFLDAYLACAWVRRPLTRDALLAWPPRSAESDAIPNDLFAAVGI